MSYENTEDTEEYFNVSNLWQYLFEELCMYLNIIVLCQIATNIQQIVSSNIFVICFSSFFLFEIINTR
jgi:hypothetical protein